MKKKGMALTTLIVLLLLGALLVLIFMLFFIGPKAVLNMVAKSIMGMTDRILITIGFKTEKPMIESDKSMEESFHNIVSILRTEGNGPCIFKYKPFPNGISDFKIRFSKSETEQGIYAEMINREGQTVLHQIVSGEKKVPCVVGEGEAAKNFYDNYLDGTPCTDGCPQEYTAAGIILAGGKIYVNCRSPDLNGCSARSMDDRNLVFKAKDGNICFFPTKTVNGWFGCDAAQNGLDNDCMLEVEKSIKKCGGEEIKGAEYKEIFFEGTYYGKLGEWKIVSSSIVSGRYYYYTGTDSRVPYMFRIEAKDASLGRKGMTESEYNNLFSSASENAPAKQGVYFEKIYYGNKEDWKFESIGLTKKWIYTGKDGDVPERFKTNGIVIEEKLRVFGPPSEETGG